MLLFVGLGNPTPDSENNRHNVGFKIIDTINKKFSLSKQKPKFKGLLTTGNIGDKKVYAIKPLTFMNNSGVCIRELIEYFKIDAEDVIVFHDDLDVEFGKIKTKFGGSSAGHNGISSIDKLALSRALNEAGIGPVSINTGSSPTTDIDTISARGLALIFFKPASLQTITAAAPSVI